MTVRTARYGHPVCWVLVEMPNTNGLDTTLRDRLQELNDRHRGPLQRMSINAAADGQRFLIKVAADPSEIPSHPRIVRVYTQADQHELVPIVRDPSWEPPLPEDE